MNSINSSSYNKYYGRKRICKLSLITDKVGIPYNLTLNNGKCNDAIILEQQLLQPMLIDIPTNGSYFLADKGYDTIRIREKLTNLGYWPLIAKNRRNNNKSYDSMTKHEKKIYKKRIRIENIFLNLKYYRRILTRYDKYETVFLGFVYLALIILIKCKY